MRHDPPDDGSPRSGAEARARRRLRGSLGGQRRRLRASGDISTGPSPAKPEPGTASAAKLKLIEALSVICVKSNS